LADSYGMVSIYHILAYLPLLGIVAGLLPNMQKKTYPA
jgi:hypothetical protein